MVARQHYRWDFIGLSTDNKPTPATSEKVVDGSTFYCSDNSKLYVWYNDQWYEKVVSGGGGGGGASYTAGDGIDITNAVISATNTGKAKVLTTDDYNYPTTGTKDGVALWLLEPGIYTVYSGTKWYSTSATSYDTNTALAIIRPERSGLVPMLYARNEGDWQCQRITKSTGVRSGSLDALMSTAFIVDNLTSTSTTSPLSANQGKVLKDLVDSLAIRASGAPTTATVGSVGTLYEDTTNGKLYQCTDTTGGSYTWVEVGGGSGVTVVQTTGTSTTDVMSQNAVTSMVFADPSTKQKVQIGNDATASQSQTIAIGYSAYTNKSHAIAVGQQATALGVNSIALGAGSSTNVQGQMDISVIRYGNYSGYNNSNYRLLTGLYDGQSAHDAATVGQITPTTDSSAPTTATAGRLGEIRIDTTTNTAYMCVLSDSTTPAYEWKQITA